MATMTFVRQFLRDERGATVVEYGLIAVVLSLAIVAGFSTLADRLQSLLGVDIVGKLAETD
jgi:pilus assembly protein Flp/PilA